MIGLPLTDITLGVLVGILVIEIVVIVLLAWAMLRKVKKLEKAIEQFRGVR